MATERKLGRPADQRKALLRNQVTQLIWNGKIVTTLDRAKEVRSIAEKLITLAMRECDNTVEVTKTYKNDKGQEVTETFVNDAPSKLHARRILMAYLYDIPEQKKDDESKADFKARTKDNKHPVVEKMFREYAPKYNKRKEELGQGGGYYDRLLPQLRCPTALICREQLMSPEVPVEEHDMRCTMLITEKGILTPEA